MMSPMNIKVPLIVAAMLTFFGCGGASENGETTIGGGSGVLTGRIEQIPESRGILVWGDSINQLCQQWSVALFDQSGWFYGTNNSWSSADVYVLAAPNDPLSVVAAKNFDYVTGAVQAHEGDTVFFRGRNGFFGAWTITVVEGDRDAVLTGEWYFKAGGGGDFTRTVVDGGTSDYVAGIGVCDRY